MRMLIEAEGFEQKVKLADIKGPRDLARCRS
jgi:hypothetical protein